MRWLSRAVLVVMVVISATALQAQTATPTPAPTATPSPTPEFYRYWALPTLVISGTPQPPQMVAFGYTADAGDVAILLPGIAIVFALWAMFIIWLRLGQKDSSNGGGRQSVSPGTGDRRDDSRHGRAL